jgi:hypothetical protein
VLAVSHRSTWHRLASCVGAYDATDASGATAAVAIRAHFTTPSNGEISRPVAVAIRGTWPAPARPTSPDWPPFLRTPIAVVGNQVAVETQRHLFLRDRGATAILLGPGTATGAVTQATVLDEPSLKLAPKSLPCHS